MDEARLRRDSAFYAILGSLLFYVLLISAAYSVTSKRHLPNIERETITHGFAGDIYSADGFLLATTVQSFRAEIDLRSFNLDKGEYFFKLFSIYSGLPNAEVVAIKERLIAALEQKKIGTFILSKNINSKNASYLQELSRKLNTQNFFLPFKNTNGKTESRGLEIVENRQIRDYPKKDLLSPVLGYSQTAFEQNFAIDFPKKGLDKTYQSCLFARQNSRVVGFKDIGKNVVIHKNSFLSSKEDGCNLYLNINLKLQARIESMLDAKLELFGASEIIASVMDAKTGRILALASSKRFNPMNRSSDLSLLNPSATEVPFEPGSVIKPLAFSLALQLGRIKLEQNINTHNGSYTVDGFKISDTHPAPFMKAKDVVVHSSNIGMAMISKEFSSTELYHFYQSFGLDAPSGIDLAGEVRMPLIKPKQIRASTKATLSYGYGLSLNFMQLLRAYAAFVNEGLITAPQLARGYVYKGSKYELKPAHEPKRVLDLKTAQMMKGLLIDTANAYPHFPPGLRESLEIGGKTGTALRHGPKGYIKGHYNSSFFGFAADNEHSLVLGVTVFDMDNSRQSYYAAQTALPTFVNMVEALVELDFLRPRK